MTRPVSPNRVFIFETDKGGCPELKKPRPWKAGAELRWAATWQAGQFTAKGSLRKTLPERRAQHHGRRVAIAVRSEPGGRGHFQAPALSLLPRASQKGEAG